MSTRLRHIILVLVASACLAPLVCAGSLYLPQPREGLKAHLYQVRPGMSRDRAEAIIGRAPDQTYEAVNSGVSLW